MWCVVDNHNLMCHIIFDLIWFDLFIIQVHSYEKYNYWTLKMIENSKNKINKDNEVPGGFPLSELFKGCPKKKTKQNKKIKKLKKLKN